VRALAGAFAVGLIAAIVAVLAVARVSTGQGATGVAVVVFGFVAAAALSVVSGVFGREFALIGVGWCGAWTALTGNVVLRSVTDDADLLAGFVAVLALTVGGFFVSFVSWFIGTLVCGLSGHFTSRDLSEIAYARTSSAGSASGQHFSELLDQVGDRHAGDERVTARSMGVERRTTWSRPVAIVTTDRRLIVAPLNHDYELDNDVLTVPAHALASASVASLDRNGSTRRSLSSHDDHVDVTTTEGDRRRFVLAYESRTRPDASAAAPQVGGADAIRHWIRTNATTYH
jgi:hypothetical protein